MGNPKRYIVTVRGNTSPGMVTFVGTNLVRSAIAEETPCIPVLKSGEEYTYITMHAYATMIKSHIGLTDAQITLGSVESPCYSAQLPSSLSERDKADIRAMIREEIAALKKDLVREVASEIAKQTRLYHLRL